jgi:hypothetical protein
MGGTLVVVRKPQKRVVKSSGNSREALLSKRQRANLRAKKHPFLGGGLEINKFDKNGIKVVLLIINTDFH